MSVRETAGWWDESDRARIRVTGRDRVKFLQNMTSQDVKALAPGDAAWACALTIKAKLVAAFRVASAADAFILDIERERGAALLEHLRKFVVVNQVVFTDETETTGAIAIEGPRVEEALGQAAAGDGTLVARGAGITGERCARIYGPRAAIAAAITRLGSQPPVSPSAVEVLRVENGTPRFGADLDEDTLPPETPLDRTALSYTKGCFLGQEPIARIHFRGHVNKSLRGLVFRQPATPGKLLGADGKDVGRVTSIVEGSALGTIGLGYVRREAGEPGTRLTVEGGGEVEVRALPLVKPTDPEPERAPAAPTGPGPALKPGSSGPAAIMPGGAPK
jgi:folate-binding protein YgfZ